MTGPGGPVAHEARRTCAIGRASRNDSARRTEREARTAREAIEGAATPRASSRLVLGPDRTLELEAGGRRPLVHYGSGYRHAQVFAPGCSANWLAPTGDGAT